MDVDFIRAMDAIILNGYNRGYDRPLSRPVTHNTSSSPGEPVTANKNTSLSIPKPSCPNHLLPFKKWTVQLRLFGPPISCLNPFLKRFLVILLKTYCLQLWLLITWPRNQSWTSQCRTVRHTGPWIPYPNKFTCRIHSSWPKFFIRPRLSTSRYSLGISQWEIQVKFAQTAIFVCLHVDWPLNMNYGCPRTIGRRGNLHWCHPRMPNVPLHVIISCLSPVRNKTGFEIFLLTRLIQSHFYKMRDKTCRRGFADELAVR